MSFAPSAESRDSSIAKKSSGNIESSSQYAPFSVIPRILLSDWAFAAPSRYIFLPNRLPSFRLRLYEKQSPKMPHIGSSTLRRRVVRVFPAMR